MLVLAWRIILKGKRAKKHYLRFAGPNLGVEIF